MPTITRIATGLLMLVGTALPADAQWRWLEHMSGPGWYDGASLEYKLFCVYPKKEGAERATTLDTEAIPVISAPCRVWNKKTGDKLKPRRHTLGLSGSLLWSTINRLEYDPSVPVEDTQVWIASPGAFYDLRLFGRVEVGGSVEYLRFFGTAMSPMSRWAYEARSTVNLWTMKDGSSGNPIAHLKFRIGVMRLDSIVTPADFGAVSGPGLDEPEWLTSARVVFDFECLPWRKGGC